MGKKTLIFAFIFAFFILPQLFFKTPLTLPVLRLDGRIPSFLNPGIVDAAGLSSASALLSNPRLSFQGRVSGAYAAGTNVITLATTANTYGDIDTKNLFPNDTVAIGVNGNIPVGTISASTIFTLKNALAVSVGASTNIYATQSGTLTVAFYTAEAIPVGGSILVQIPASNGAISGATSDGLPDTTTALTSNGFDLNGMTNTSVTCPNGAFAAGTLTAGAGGAGAPHTISCNYSGAVPVQAGANLSIVVGTVKQLINPAPVNTGHTRGVADTYDISIFTKDAANGTGNTIESVDSKVAPIEGVLVSAIVDETLSFTIAGVAAGASTFCGLAHTAGITTTATAVTYGAINSSYTIDKNTAVQQLTVTTNAPTGYTVYAVANDQMGKDGNTCTGSVPILAEYGFTGGSTCIRDVNCGGGAYSTCTHTTSGEWNTAPNGNGFGYALANQSGSDATFLFNESARNFSSRQFSDAENSSASASIMTNTGVVSGSSVYVCYRINIPATQPAGYYFNKLKYTAVAKF
ncbi:hypothetical protein HZC27_00370 [Candidatus Roizmanbacteria bacterium]|nr:hypothetical protein [Candidatus Roizmanbacteria bacterium]